VRGGLLPRDADDVLAVGFEERLAFGVVGSGLRGVVPLRAVGLDDEVVLGPAEVGDDAAAVQVQGDVDVRRCEAGGGEQVVDAVFQLGAGGGWVAAQDPREARTARAAGGRSSWRPRRRRLVSRIDCARLIIRASARSCSRDAMSSSSRSGEVVGMPR
jgi:hypothetical protein